MKLVVTHAFDKYAIGDEITDPATVAAILASEQSQLVVKVATTDAVAPEDAPARKAK